MPIARPDRARRVAARAAAVLAVLAVVAPALLVVGGARGASGGCAYVTNPYGIAVNVTWNGRNVCEAGSPSSAFSVDLTKSIGLVYSWLSPTIAVNDARLQMFYFGFAVATRDVQIVGGLGNGPGGVLTPAAQTVPMNWTPGAIAYVLSGAYSLSASLVAPNGTTVFSEHFFVHANAPFVLGALLPILLIVIAVWELYQLATSGKADAPRSKTKDGATPPPNREPAPTSPAEEPPEGTPPTSTEEP